VLAHFLAHAGAVVFENCHDVRGVSSARNANRARIAAVIAIPHPMTTEVALRRRYWTIVGTPMPHNARDAIAMMRIRRIAAGGSSDGSMPRSKRSSSQGIGDQRRLAADMTDTRIGQRLRRLKALGIRCGASLVVRRNPAVDAFRPDRRALQGVARIGANPGIMPTWGQPAW
jgi:hypothetical protein